GRHRPSPARGLARGRSRRRARIGADLTGGAAILSLVNVAWRLLAVVLLVAACASTKPLIEQRTTIGPVADDVWAYRILTMNRRAPTFDERRLWETQLELAITRYLAKDEELASSPQLSTFRFLHQPTVGMSKEAVLILLDAPERTTSDVAEM